MLGRHLRTLATGAVFTLVSVGFAYAVPNSLGGSGTPGRAHITLVEADDASGGQGAGHRSAGADERSEPGKGSGSARPASGGTKENHGAVVRTAAHCDVPGKAHGELVRSIAGDKDATVADAAAACETAQANAPEGDRLGGSSKSAKPDKPAHPAKPDKPGKPEKPSTPEKPDQPGAAKGSGSPAGSTAPGSSNDDKGPKKS